jgi:hypothetical protein
MIITTVPGEVILLRAPSLREAAAVIVTGTVETLTVTVHLIMASGREPSMHRLLPEEVHMTEAVAAEAVPPRAVLPVVAEVDREINFSTNPFYV